MTSLAAGTDQSFRLSPATAWVDSPLKARLPQGGGALWDGLFLRWGDFREEIGSSDCKLSEQAFSLSWSFVGSGLMGLKVRPACSLMWDKITTEVEVTNSPGLFCEVGLFIGKSGVLRLRKGQLGGYEQPFNHPTPTPLSLCQRKWPLCLPEITPPSLPWSPLNELTCAYLEQGCWPFSRHASH